MGIENCTDAIHNRALRRWKESMGGHVITMGRSTSPSPSPHPAHAQASCHWTAPFTPTTNEWFVSLAHWPKIETSKQTQDFAVKEKPANCVESNDGLVQVDGRKWIPSTATELIQRLMIVAHNGLQGHAGVKSTIMTLNREFCVHGMDL
jgi:hypothetical protein